MIDVAIIGAGVTGLYSAYCCSVTGLTCAVFEALPYVGGQCSALYARKLIYGVPGINNCTAKQFIDNLYEQCKNTKFYLNSLASINIKNDKFIVISGSNIVQSEYLLISSGIGRMVPLVPQNIKGIQQLRNTTDFVQFYNMDLELYKNKVVVVAGGSDSAIDFAINISKVASKVIIIHRRSVLSCDHNKLSELSKIELQLEQNIQELQFKKVITDKEIFEVDFIVFCYGFIPDNTLLNNLDVELEQNLIKISLNTMRTSLRHCYAAGDVVKYSGKKKDILSCCFEAKRAIQSINDDLRINGKLY